MTVTQRISRTAQGARLIPRLALANVLLVATLMSASAQPAGASQQVGALPVGQTSYPPPPGALYTSTSGSDANSGSERAPLRTIARAVSAAPWGGTVVVRGGTYREQVKVYGKKVTIQPYPGEAVWLSGSDVISGWVADGSAWRKDGWTASFARVSSGPRIDPAKPLAGWPDMVFYDGRSLRQVSSRAAVTPGTFYVDYTADKLFVGDNPAGRLVEASVRSEALHLNKANSSIVRGIGVKHYATPTDRFGAVRGYADNLLFENVVFLQNAAAGVSLIGSNITVRNSTSESNGQLGLHAHNTRALRVEGTSIVGNNTEGFVQTHAAGGAKLTRATAPVFKADRIERNTGTGLWFDESSSDIVVASSLVSNNVRHGIAVELSARATIVSNVAAYNGESGVMILDSSDIGVWNNTLVQNHRGIYVVEGTRTSATPGFTWDVDRITVRNNVISQGSLNSPSLLGVEDVRKQESAASMGVSFDYNAYYRTPSSAPPLAHWSGWPTRMVVLDSLAQFQGVGQEKAGFSAIGGSNPFLAANWKLPANSPAKGKGLPLPLPIASAGGLPAGTPVDLGVLTDVH